MELFKRVLTCLIILCCAACASVDQFGGRITDGNLNSQGSLNQEVLLNIARASLFRSLNFVGVAQISGGQSEQLTTGLPTALFGNVAAAAQVYALSNSVQSGVTGNYQASPLISTSFQSGMLAPTNPRALAWLIGSYPRAVVLFAMLEAVRIRNVGTGLATRLDNDPEVGIGDACDAVVERISEPEVCGYVKFVNFLNVLLGYGFTVELRTVAAPRVASGAAPAPAIEGHFCFDPTLASVENRLAVSAGRYQPLCERSSAAAGAAPPATTSAAGPRPGDAEARSAAPGGDAAPPGGGSVRAGIRFLYRTYGSIEIEPVVRSPQRYFAYLGAWARVAGRRDFPGYRSRSANLVYGGGPYLAIDADAARGCYSSVAYSGRTYCVPATASHTAMLMDIAESLRNLSITPADLNAAFSVRLTP